jgi:EAL domain-containing protein (putative c-di-GMP-specific phosphodiesterase class I)
VAVERDEQRSLLEGLGISLVQGFLFSRPGPASVIEELLVRDARRLAAA